MGQELLVSNIRIIANKIIADHGDLRFFSLWKDEIGDTFTLIISAEWLDAYSPLEGISLVSNYIFKNLKVKERIKISRIMPIHSSDRGIFAFYGMRVRQSTVRITNSRFNNVEVKEAYVFELT